MKFLLFSMYSIIDQYIHTNTNIIIYIPIYSIMISYIYICVTLSSVFNIFFDQSLVAQPFGATVDFMYINNTIYSIVYYNICITDICNKTINQ